MFNSFFTECSKESDITQRILDVESGKVGFYSIGLYPASLAYNCAMQSGGTNLLLAPRPGRDLLGAFNEEALAGMDDKHLATLLKMSRHKEGERFVDNNLSDLILRCELVILSSNSNHIQEDLKQACLLREKLNRKNVLLGCLSGSFSHDIESNNSYILCGENTNLGFFSGFHRHGALRNPLDSFTANFCHPEVLTAMLAARMLDKLSKNIQVSPGVHNVEGHYIKAAKNMASIFAGFGHTFHKNNPGLLPTLLTLLLNQCLDQAANVSMLRNDRDRLYNSQKFSLTELGYGVQKIEAALIKDGDMQNVRDHTFSQLTAMVADVRGSMMIPNKGNPTRNFQAGQILANNMLKFQRCPHGKKEFFNWCELEGLERGSLEGLKSLEFWPQILNNYSIPLNDSSMINLLYVCVFGDTNEKKIIYRVLTSSRELTNYCQESVRPNHSRKIADALNYINEKGSLELIVNTIINGYSNDTNNPCPDNNYISTRFNNSPYYKALSIIEAKLGTN